MEVVIGVIARACHTALVRGQDTEGRFVEHIGRCIKSSGKAVDGSSLDTIR